jgi:hypothetical protein
MLLRMPDGTGVIAVVHGRARRSLHTLKPGPAVGQRHRETVTFLRPR